MTPLDRALERVQIHTLSGHSFGLAIHIAARELDIPQKEITDALAARRKAKADAKNTRKAYQETVKPHWTDCY